MNKGLLDKDAAVAFITAPFGRGKATVTLENNVNGVSFTYRITRAKDSTRSRFFVGLMTGPSNTDHYTYIGQILDGKFMATNGTKVSTNSRGFKAFDLTWKCLTSRHDMPQWLNVWHEGRCGRCGKKLTTVESISTGIGPVCAGRIAKSHAPHWAS